MSHCGLLQQWRYDAVIDCFVAYNATVTHSAFHWAGQPSKIAPSLGILTPI